MKSDEQIEQMLREAWNPQPSAALRGRITSQTAHSPAGARLWGRLQVCAACGVAGMLVALSYLNQQQEVRISTVINNGVSAQQKLDIADYQRLQAMLSAKSIEELDARGNNL
ncbi:MAG: hypothetical protein WCL39_00145 [Armatimonadota bacterium]